MCLQPSTSQTCHALRHVISNSVSLRYKLALCEHGMCDGPRNGLNKAEKLGLLTAYVSAWGDINSAKPEEVQLFTGLGYPLVVSGNTLVFYKPMSQNKFPGPHRELIICRAPSAIRRIEQAHWVLTVPFGITDICIDASQDLFIYFLYVSSRFSLCLPSFTFWCDVSFHFFRSSRFHIRSLSSGKAHPSAERSEFVTDRRNRKDVNYSRVCGDYVAARVDFGHISVSNWKTGEQVSHKVSTFARSPR